MARRRSFGSSTTSLKGLRSNLRQNSSSYSDFLSQRKKEIRAESTLKYGGGFGRKILYAGTKAITGERAADAISQLFRNRSATEEAYQTLVGSKDEGSDKKESTKLKRIESSISETNTNIDELQNQNTEILNILEDISKKLSPKDITVGKGEAAQTFRYDPLAPEGRKVTVVTASGKAGRFASKKESFSVLSKAAYLSNIMPMGSREPVLKKLPNSPKVIRAAIEDARNFDAPARKIRREPETYEELLGATKRMTQAEKTLRYGGKGLGRRALFGITKGLVGEETALKIATLGRNKKQTEEAFQTIKNRGLLQAETPNPMMGKTKTQLSAAEAVQERTKSELAEADTEWKDDVIARLKRIEEKECGDGGGLSIGRGIGIGAALAAVSAAVSTAIKKTLPLVLRGVPYVGPALIAYEIGKSIWDKVTENMSEDEETNLIDQILQSTTLPDGTPIVPQFPDSPTPTEESYQDLGLENYEQLKTPEEALREDTEASRESMLESWQNVVPGARIDPETGGIILPSPDLEPLPPSSIPEPMGGETGAPTSTGTSPSDGASAANPAAAPQVVVMPIQTQQSQAMPATQVASSSRSSPSIVLTQNPETSVQAYNRNLFYDPVSYASVTA